MKGLDIKTCKIFKQKPGANEAAAIIEFSEQKAEEKNNATKNIFLTKEDKTEMIKWMVIFWMGQSGAMVALVLLYIKNRKLSNTGS